MALGALLTTAVGRTHAKIFAQMLLDIKFETSAPNDPNITLKLPGQRYPMSVIQVSPES